MLKKKVIYVNIRNNKIVEKSPIKQAYINVTCELNKICRMEKNRRIRGTD